MISTKWKVILGIAFLPLLVGFFYVEEDARGIWAWSSFKHAQEARGEKFSISDFAPPPVPDDENLAMTPLLRPACDFTYGRKGEALRRDPKAWEHLSDINLAASYASGKWPDLGDPDQGALADLNAAAAFYHNNPHYPQSRTPGNSAEIILAALDKFAPDLQELREAAAARPSSRFPIDYSHQPAYTILLPHLACVKGIVSVCELRAVAELETGRSADAFADLQLAFRLSDSIRDEPILIDHLVRIATLNISVQGIREGIARHAWSDSQLQDFEKYLVTLDLLSEYKHAMRGERAFSVTDIDYLRRHRGVMPDASVPDYRAFAWFPGGWYRQNMRLIGEMHRDFLLPSVDESNRVVSPELGDRMLRNLAQHRAGPCNLYAKILLPALGNVAMRPARCETWVDEARVACALERYRLEHHDLPGSLDVLTPQFIPAIPNDLFDGHPLRYHQNTDGTYLLYSIGWNKVDDGGVVHLKPGRSPHADLTQGDWVWQFPAK